MANRTSNSTCDQHLSDLPEDADLDRVYIAGRGRLSQKWLQRELDAFLHSSKMTNALTKLVNSAVTAHLRRGGFRRLVAELVADHVRDVVEDAVRLRERGRPR